MSAGEGGLEFSGFIDVEVFEDHSVVRLIGEGSGVVLVDGFLDRACHVVIAAVDLDGGHILVGSCGANLWRTTQGGSPVLWK